MFLARTRTNANCKPKLGKTDFQILCYVLVKYVNVTTTLNNNKKSECLLQHNWPKIKDLKPFGSSDVPIWY